MFLAPPPAWLHAGEASDALASRVGEIDVKLSPHPDFSSHCSLKSDLPRNKLRRRFEQDVQIRWLIIEEAEEFP